MKIEIRDTGHYGNGVYALATIAAGERIHLFSGRRITLAECGEMVQHGDQSNDDSFQIALEEYLILEPLSNTFNHSCAPNAGIRGSVELFALRDIAPGEEITYDYSTVVAPNITPDLWTMPCACGAAECRGVIGNILSLPEETLARYMRLGAVPEYLAERVG